MGTRLDDDHSVGAADSFAALALAAVGALAVGLGLHFHWLSGLAATYLSHAWFVAIPLVWYFGLARRFPVGRLKQDQLRPWYALWSLEVIGNVAVVMASPPQAVHLPPVPTLIGDLVFLAVLVGPTEELLFRGLIQTGLNRTLPAAVHWHSWSLSLGTVFAALAFGLWHFVNLTYQAWGPTLEQVAAATLFGLIIGVFYARTGNLVGASIMHNLNDFLGASLPLAAWLLATHQ